MSNHSDRGSPLPEAIAHALGKPLIGATGLHTERKLTPDDEGGIQFAIGVKDGKVCIDFGTPCKWVGMTPEQALDMASSLIAHAKKLRAAVVANT